MSLRARLNRWRRRVVHGVAFRILFGEASGARDLTMARISPSTMIDHEEGLVLGDHTYIGPFNVIEASAGVTIEEGVQVTSHCAIVTHSSHRAQRLLGRSFVSWRGKRPGWVEGPIRIGAYSFIGPHSLIEAGTVLGRGTLVRAGSVVRGVYPEFAVLQGNPARCVGDTRDADARWLEAHPSMRPLVEPLRADWAGPLVPPEAHDALDVHDDVGVGGHERGPGHA